MGASKLQLGVYRQWRPSLIRLYVLQRFQLFRPVVAIVANLDTTQVLIKATGDLSQPGNSPVCSSIVFALFEQKYDV